LNEVKKLRKNLQKKNQKTNIKDYDDEFDIKHSYDIINIKFEFKEWEDYGDEQHFIGTFYVPDLELENGKKVVGILEGRIVKFENETVSPDFYSKDGYDIFEFCNGLEYELDSFIDYVVSEIEGNYKSKD